MKRGSATRRKRRRGRGRPPRTPNERVRAAVREYGLLSLLAAWVGVLAALGAVIFRLLILSFQTGFTGGTDLNVDSVLDMPYGPLTLAAPIIGGLLVGLVVHRFAPETRGHGVPEVMAAVAKKGGVIRPRVAVVKSIASSITIGSGGSAGREGPIVQIGSALGSMVAQKIRLPKDWLKIMVACGAAGGITATFNTPIAGVIFALELILLEFKTRSFIPLVVSAVSATIISRVMLGDQPAFALSQTLLNTFVLVTPGEIFLYLLLGLMTGLVGVLFVKTLYGVEGLFDRLRIPPYLKPCVGGILISLLMLATPRVMGVGYESVNMALTGGLALGLMLLLVVLKLMATSFTIGSGGSGGIFSPSLFIGAMLGGSFGILLNTYLPGISGPSGAYAIVGMGAFFASVSRGTFTSIIIIFEMTRNYSLILPIMFACVVSDAVSVVLMKETIYTTKLARRGLVIAHDMEVERLKMVKVKEVMVPRRRVVTVRPEWPISKVYDLILRTEHMGFPVCDGRGNCVGVVTFHDVDTAFRQGRTSSPVKELCTLDPIVAGSDETLEGVLHKMLDNGISHIPVVRGPGERRLVGFITKWDVLRQER